MPLLKPALEADLRALFTDLSTTTDSQRAMDQLVSRMAAIIDTYVRSATVTVTVATTGTAVAQTGTGTGSLS